MKITKQQTKLFALKNEEAFVKATERYLIENHADALEQQKLKPTDLEKFVRKSMTEAEKYNVVNEPDIRFYCECKLLLGPKFDRAGDTAWAGEILKRTDIDGAEKMTLINEHMVFELDEPQ